METNGTEKEQEEGLKDKTRHGRREQETKKKRNEHMMNDNE